MNTNEDNSITEIQNSHYFCSYYITNCEGTCNTKKQMCCFSWSVILLTLLIIIGIISLFFISSLSSETKRNIVGTLFIVIYLIIGLFILCILISCIVNSINVNETCLPCLPNSCDLFLFGLFRSFSANLEKYCLRCTLYFCCCCYEKENYLV